MVEFQEAHERQPLTFFTPNPYPFMDSLPKHKPAFMNDALSPSEKKAIADSIAENREALEIMAKK